MVNFLTLTTGGEYVQDLYVFGEIQTLCEIVNPQKVTRRKLTRLKCETRGTDTPGHSRTHSIEHSTVLPVPLPLLRPRERRHDSQSVSIVKRVS